MKLPFVLIGHFQNFPLVPHATYSVQMKGNIIRLARPDAVYWIDFKIRGKAHLFPCKAPNPFPVGYLHGGEPSLKKHCRLYAGLRFLINRLWLPRGAP